MRALAGLLMIAAPSIASAQSGSSPHKLIVALSEGGITSIDYPSSERCLRAKAVIDADKDQRIAEQKARANVEGGIITRYGFITFTLCVPG